MPEQDLPTIQEVEESGQWISAANSGHHPNRVMDWRRSGRLKEEDYRNEQVRYTERLSKKVFFYRPESLAREAAKDKADKVPHSEKMKAHWKQRERIPIKDDELLREKAAAAELGVADVTLRRMKLPTVQRRGLKYWKLSSLKRKSLPSSLPPDLYSLEKTAELTGLGLKTLRENPHGRKLGLIRKEVRLGRERQYGDQIRQWSRWVHGFTKTSVDEYVRRHPPLVRSPGYATSAETAKRLRVHRRTVINLCVEGILAGSVPDRFPTSGGDKDGWLIPEGLVAKGERIIRGIMGKTRRARLKRVRLLREKLPNGDTVPEAAPVTAPVAIPAEQPTPVTLNQVSALPAKGKRGRKPSKLTAACYKFCWEQYTQTDRKLASIRRDAEKQFPKVSPRQDSHVTQNAKRYAQSAGIPWITRTEKA